MSTASGSVVATGQPDPGLPAPPRLPDRAAAAVVLLDRQGCGTCLTPEDIALWRAWRKDRPWALPVLDVLLIDGLRWRSLAELDGLLG